MTHLPLHLQARAVSGNLCIELRITNARIAEATKMPDPLKPQTDPPGRSAHPPDPRARSICLRTRLPCCRAHGPTGGPIEGIGLMGAWATHAAHGLMSPISLYSPVIYSYGLYCSAPYFGGFMDCKKQATRGPWLLSSEAGPLHRFTREWPCIDGLPNVVRDASIGGHSVNPTQSSRMSGPM